jgi:fatty acid desaturase
MHEAVHKNLPMANDLYSAILCAYPIGLSIGYRETHLKHHRYVGTIDDPDFEYYKDFPTSKLQLIGRLIKYASGLPAIFQFFHIHTQRKIKSNGEFIPLLLVQITIFTGIYYVFNSPHYYLIYWALPVATVGKLLSSTRLMCEHSSPQGWVIRTITGPRYRTWFLGAFDFNYHAEHHLIPSIPFAHLKRLHGLKMINQENNSIKEIDLKNNIVYFSGCYLELLIEFFISLPWLAPKIEI